MEFPSKMHMEFPSKMHLTNPAENPAGFLGLNPVGIPVEISDTNQTGISRQIQLESSQIQLEFHLDFQQEIQLEIQPDFFNRDNIKAIP